MVSYMSSFSSHARYRVMLSVAPANCQLGPATDRLSSWHVEIPRNLGKPPRYQVRFVKGASLVRWVLEVINTVGVPRTPHESED
jgi:hypothetical protein